MIRKLGLQHVEQWEKIPDVWKETSKVRKIDLYEGLKKDGIKDKGLLKVVEKFMSDDALRPSYQGIGVEKNVIFATNAMVVISIPAELGIEEDNFLIDPKISKKVGTPLYSKISNKFPDVRKILSAQSFVSRVDSIKLKSYISAIINGKYTNEITNQIIFYVNNDMNIGLNGKMLLDCIDALLMLGYDELYFAFNSPSKGVYISPNEKTAKNPGKFIGEYPFVLMMPLMFSKEVGLGAADIDMDTSCKVYFSFSDNEIHNADGSVARYERNITNTALPYIDSESMALISKLIPKVSRIPIMEYVKVENTKATVSNLEYFLEVKDVFVEDGFYKVCNGALKDVSGYDLEDYPVPKRKDDTLTPLGVLMTDDFAQRTKEALPFLGEDEMRASLMGVCLESKDGVVTLTATNAHILSIAKINGQLDFPLKILIQNSKMLSYFLSAVNDKSVKLSAKNYKDGNFDNLFIESDNYVYSTRLIDEKAPNYEAVIDNKLNSYLSFNTAKMLKVISSIKGEDAKKSLVFDLKGGLDDVEIQLGESKYGEFEILKGLGVKTDFFIGKSDKQFKSDIAVIMPINTYEQELFGFDIKFLKSVLLVSNGDEVKFHFDSAKIAPQCVTELMPTIPSEPVKNIERKVESEPKASQEEVRVKIDALQILADMGDKEAEDTIKILKLLL